MAHPYTRKAAAGLHWSTAEKRLIAAESLRLMAQQHELTRIDAVRKAVMSLPKPRRREVRDMASIRWILALWSEIAEERDALNESSPTRAAAIPEVQEVEPDNQGEPDDETSNSEESIPEESIPKRKGMAVGTKLVRWTDEERRIIAKAFLKMRADFPDMRETEALRKAMQYSLPDDRQRKIASYAEQKEWLTPLLTDVKTEFEREQLDLQARREAEHAAEQQAIDEERKQAEALRLAEEKATLERFRDMETAAREAIEGQSFEDVLALMLEKFTVTIAAKLLPAIEATVKAAMSGMPAKDPFAGFPREVIPEAERVVAAPRDHKPRVLICGLLNQQINDVERDFKKVLELSFHKGNGEGGSPLEPKLKGADIVIQMTAFSGHDREETFKKAGIKPVRINGSTSAVKRYLRQWLTGEPLRMQA
jgi:hypothetical protein